MKTYLSAIILLLLPFLSQAQFTAMPGDTISQCTDSIGERFTWHDPMGTASTNYLGFMYTFITTNNKYPSVYLFNAKGKMVPLCMYSNSDNNKNYLDYFGYYKEGYEYKLVNQVFTFRFMGRLWYFQNVISKDGDSIHECFAQLPQAGQKAYKKCLAYHTDWKFDKQGVTYAFKAGAFQMDSCLYFLCNYVDPYGGSNSTDWAIQKYSWDVNKQRFELVSQIKLPANCFGNSRALAGMITRYNSHNHKYSQILCTYSGLNDQYLCKLDISGTIYRTQQVDHYKQPGNYTTQGAAIVPGTIQAKRTMADEQDLAQSDRFTVFMADPTYTNGSDACRLELIEYYFVNDSVVHHYDTHSIYIASDEQPKGLTRYNATLPYIPISGTYSLSGGQYNSSDSVDGMRENVWVFYPSDKDHYIAGVGFYSDLYLSPPDSVSPRSDDLGNVSKYTDKIKSLWTLVGILEGAPPIPIKWETWDSLYPPEYSHDPSELVITNTVDQDIEVGSSFEDEFTAGTDIKTMQEYEGVEIEEGINFQFTGTFKNRYSKGSSVSYEFVTKFPLSESLQDSGYFLWAYPNIVRIPYCRYPWWGDKSLNDGKFSYPVPNSAQYMFHTYGISIKREPVHLSSWPFYINNPNGDDDPPDQLMKDWYLENRPEIQKVLDYNPYHYPVSTPSVTDFAGNSSGFTIKNDNTSSTETSTSYDVDADVTLKVPLIFEIGVSAGNDVKYTNETTVKSTFGQNIMCEMNSKFAFEGLRLKDESISLYWFRPNDNVDYWYFQSDSSMGNKPWYLAYIVSLNTSKVHLISPTSGITITESELLFSWKPERLDDAEYLFLIATTQTLKRSTIVYEENVGSKTESNPAGFKPEKGTTYYWAVMAKSPHGNIVWSDVRSFTSAVESQPVSQESGLKVLICPNPGTGRNMNFSFITPEAGTVLFRLYEMNGHRLYMQEFPTSGNKTESFILTQLDLRSGIYFAEIIAGKERVVKKLVILAE